jgi:hypothetical protein
MVVRKEEEEEEEEEEAARCVRPLPSEGAGEGK